MTPTDHAELARLAEAIGSVEWHAGHLCRDDHPCDCAYVFDDGHAGAIATVHVSNGLPISDGGNDAPEPELAKLHQAFIAAANPARVLALVAEIAALRGGNDVLEVERLGLRAAIFGSHDYDPSLRHANFIEMARLTEEARKGALSRATQAERQRDEAVGLLPAAEAAMTGLLRAVNFCEPTERLDHLALAEGDARTARNNMRTFLDRLDADHVSDPRQMVSLPPAGEE